MAATPSAGLALPVESRPNPEFPEAGLWTARRSSGWRGSSIQEAGLRGYFQSPTIWELFAVDAPICAKQG